MAKKRKINKSAAVRDYLGEHPDAKNAEVVAALGKKRIKVSSGYVSTIKTNAKQAGRKTKKSKKKVARKQTGPGQDVLHAGHLLIQAVDLVLKAGVKEARVLVDYAGKMIDRVEGDK